VEQPRHLFCEMHCLEEPLNAAGDIMDREISTLGGNIRISALKKFSIIEQNKRKFNKLLRYVENHYFF
jgi:hypothetical protein